MKIIKKTIVKHVLTEAKKAELERELERDKRQLAQEIDQLTFQLHKRLKEEPPGRSRQALKASFEKELQQRKEKMQSVEFRQLQLSKLPLGTELREGTVDTIVTLNIGDDWEAVMADEEIIIKDGIVWDIRQRSLNDDEMV